MARLLKKIPNFKLPKYRMGEIGELEELQHEYAKRHKELIRNSLESDIPRSACYPGTHFSTVKEIFEKFNDEIRRAAFCARNF